MNPESGPDFVSESGFVEYSNRRGPWLNLEGPLWIAGWTLGLTPGISGIKVNLG